MDKSNYFENVNLKFEGAVEEYQVFEVPNCSSLYLPNDEIEKFLSCVEKFIDQRGFEQRKAVFFVKGPRADDLNDFISFNPKFLRFEIEAHLNRLRQLVKSLFELSEYFVMVAEQDVLGSWFELGLSCHRIISLNHMARVGFSQLAYGLLPALGALELSLLFKKGVNKSFWEKGFLWNVLDAPEKLNVEVIPLGESEIDLKNIMRFSYYKGGLSRSMVSSRGLPFPGTFSGTKNLRKKFAEVLWDQFWEDVDGREEVFFASLNTVLASWFEASEHSVLSHSASSLYGPAQIENSKYSYNEKIWVDVSQYLPPLKVILVWIRADIEVVFFTDDLDRLSIAVKRIYEKLTSIIPKNELADLWNENVSWARLPSGFRPNSNEGESSWEKNKIIRFYSDGSIEFEKNRESHRFVRLASNDLKAKIGTAEYPLLSTSHIDHKLDDLWTNGLAYRKVVYTNSLSLLGIPASQWIRACFLEELCIEATLQKGGFKIPLKWLANQGWGYVSDESWWASHVSNRFNNWPVQNGYGFFDKFGPSEQLRNVASWKHILKIVNSTDFKESKVQGSTLDPHRSVEGMFSEHMLIFSALLGIKLFDLKVVFSINDVDVLVRYSLEVPNSFGSPLGYLKRLGKDMLYEYSACFFSHWKFEENLKSLFD